MPVKARSSPSKLQTKREAAEKTLLQRFLKEFTATSKNSSESELKATKSDLKTHLGKQLLRALHLAAKGYGGSWRVIKKSKISLTTMKSRFVYCFLTIEQQQIGPPD